MNRQVDVGWTLGMILITGCSTSIVGEIICGRKPPRIMYVGLYAGLVMAGYV